MFVPYELYVFPGGCFVGDELISCALEESSCNGFTFKSYFELLNEGTTLTTGFCWQKESLSPPPSLFASSSSNLFNGMCTSSVDNYHCTGHPSNCVISAKFVQSVPFCTIQFNHFPERQSWLSVYGECVPVRRSKDGVIQNDKSFYGDGTCVWSIDDCPGIPENNTFYPGAASLDYLEEGDTCSCEKVKTGACQYNESKNSNEFNDVNIVCAVSEEACGSSGSFLTWQELAELGGECHLCNNDDFNPKIIQGDDIPTGLLSSNRGQQNLHSNSYQVNTEEDIGTLISVNIGIWIFGFLLGALFTYQYYRHGRSKTETSSPVNNEITSDGSKIADAHIT